MVGNKTALFVPLDFELLDPNEYAEQTGMLDVGIINSSLTIQNAKLPKRSYLYHLKLQSVGSAFVESLTSYITRLAQNHNVFPGTLMEREVAPLVNKAHGGANLHKIYDYTATLNGTGIMAMNDPAASGRGIKYPFFN